MPFFAAPLKKSRVLAEQMWCLCKPTPATHFSHRLHTPSAVLTPFQSKSEISSFFASTQDARKDAVGSEVYVTAYMETLMRVTMSRIKAFV